MRSWYHDEHWSAGLDTCRKTYFCLFGELNHRDAKRERKRERLCVCACTVDGSDERKMERMRSRCHRRQRGALNSSSAQKSPARQSPHQNADHHLINDNFVSTQPFGTAHRVPDPSFRSQLACLVVLLQTLVLAATLRCLPPVTGSKTKTLQSTSAI